MNNTTDATAIFAPPRKRKRLVLVVDIGLVGYRMRRISHVEYRPGLACLLNGSHPGPWPITSMHLVCGGGLG
jgi:hypothetical protein